MATAENIWNRATLRGHRRELRRGDHALAALLQAHGLVMNGGVFHAIEVMEKNEFENAIAGYQLFGLGTVENLLMRARQLLSEGQSAEIESKEAKFDREYETLIPSDSFLFSAFERFLTTNPHDFAPL